MRGLVVGLAALLLCCGGDDEEPGLEGRWAAEVGDFCGLILDFNGDEYESLFVCELEGGDIGAQTIGGTYTTSGDRITFKPEYSSCRGVTPDTNVWTLQNGGKNLRLIAGEVIVVFERVDQSDEGDGSSGTALFGCYDEEGLFTPMTVTRQ